VIRETRRAVPLAAAEAVSVTCARCRTAFTYQLPALAEAFLPRDGGGECWCCPHCHALVQGEGAGAPTGGPFRPLLLALDALRGLQDRVEVALVFRRPQGGEGGVP
jgi:hypothetical protein